MTESSITAAIVAALRKLQKQGHRLWFFKVHGGPTQQAGVPDLHILVRGVPLYLEVKRPGGKPTRLQAVTMDSINEAGGVAAVVSSVEGAIEIVGDLLLREGAA